MSYETVQLEHADGVATITLDRPDVYNAFTATTIGELNDAIRRVRSRDGIYVTVLTGAGDGFCAGADVSNMPDWEDQTLEEYAGFLWSVQNVVRQLRAMAKPTIAAVNGPAIGAGCDFALATDLRVVAPDAVFREGFVRVGLVPGDGGAWLLPRLIGEARAKEYLLTGRDIDAEEAVSIGLATDMTSDVVQGARSLASELLGHPARSVQLTNDLMDPRLSFEEYCQRAVEYQWDCIQDPEHAEALEAMAEDREPNYEREYS